MGFKERPQIPKGDIQMKITWLTRRKSFEEIKPNRKVRYEQILESLCLGNKTAKEIAVELYKQKLTNTDERNTTAPRLTELEKMGFVEATAKKTCKYTGKTVTVYKITRLGFKIIDNNINRKS